MDTYAIDYKVEGGKLLRVSIRVSDQTIDSVRICGDFFMHPESAITDLEKALEGVRLERVADAMRRFLEEKNIEIMGFSPDDLQYAICRACKYSAL